MLRFERSGRGKPSVAVDVLVLDAQFRQALSTVRTLSRWGLNVGAVACQSEVERAIALRSRFCRLSAVVPDFSSDPGGYTDAVFELLEAHPAKLIVPCHDGSIEALRSRRSEFERRVALPLAPEAALEIALSKTRTMALAKDLGIGVPRSVVVADGRDVRAALEEIGYPAVIKPTRSWVARNRTGNRLGCEIVSSVSQAQRSVDAMNAAGGQAVFQQWLPGRRDAVTMFYARERVWARFAQTSYRELPLLGGASVLCESIPPLADLTAPAERLVRAMGLDGCSMVEFRRDGAGRPILMEVNPRMPGSVSLAISAGVDFPRLTYAWALGLPIPSVSSYQVGRRLRWLSGDIWSLKCAFDSVGHPDADTPMRAVATFLLDFGRRRSALDTIDRADLLPALIELQQMIIKPAFLRVNRSFSLAAGRVAEEKPSY